MKTFGRVMAIISLVALCATMAPAEDELFVQEEGRNAGAALGAAFGNLVFLPVRLGITAVGALTGGLTGFLTAGNRDAAGDVWDLFQGQNILTPEIVEGKEALRFSYFEFTATGQPK